MKDKTWNYKAVFWSLVGTILVIVYLLLLGCEQTDYSDEECCWFCAISTTYYYDCNPYEVTLIERYEYCEMTDSAKVAWEIEYTGEGIKDGIEFERIAKCRK